MTAKYWFLALLAPLATGCSHRPPEDFAPDPGLVSHIRRIQITTTPWIACPATTLQASYEAVLDDGTHIPFVHTYDKKHPPRLHVVFLNFWSSDATNDQNGNWYTSADPLATATTGFRLNVSLKAKPVIQGTATVQPDYSCIPHAFTFNGDRGGRAGGAGEPGPDVTVRLGLGHSPFYERLIIAGIQVGSSLPFYVLYDAKTVPPADFLLIESRGGRGGPGAPGGKGKDGVAGAAGCPAQPGGPGGDGGNGNAGAPGGRGGIVTIVVPEDQPFLAGLVTAHSRGGDGGPGGSGGAGGAGGKGGQGVGREGKSCPDGADGPAGRKGQDGPAGSEGPRGGRPEFLSQPPQDVFGDAIPPELAAILDHPPRRAR